MKLSEFYHLFPFVLLKAVKKSTEHLVTDSSLITEAKNHLDSKGKHSEVCGLSSVILIAWVPKTNFHSPLMYQGDDRDVKPSANKNTAKSTTTCHQWKVRRHTL